ncbi:MAG TPA: hypothetical protein VHG91_11760 [Longimicrobium sp.]|nr:hypothetical protein [Longimicrobium sp.]
MRFLPLRPPRPKTRAAALLVALAAALLAPAAARAQETDDDPRPRWVPLFGARLGNPQIVSAYFGVGHVEKRYESGWTGTALVVEPGIGGGQVSVARVSDVGVFSARVQASLLRTWGDPWGVGPNRTYLGAEARAVAGFVGFGVGAYARLPDDEVEMGGLLSLSLVFGV